RPSPERTARFERKLPRRPARSARRRLDRRALVARDRTRALIRGTSRRAKTSRRIESPARSRGGSPLGPAEFERVSLPLIFLYDGFPQSSCLLQLRRNQIF